MAEGKKTRNHRSKDERTAELDKKIAYHKKCIKSLENKKATIEKGYHGRTRQKMLKRLIIDAKLNDEELMKVMTLGDEGAIRAKLTEIIEAKAKED